MGGIKPTSKHILAFTILTLTLFSPSCKKETTKKAPLETPPLAGAEIEVEKITNQTGISLKILKTESIGYMPIHKFYWISLPKGINRAKVKELADVIVKETIAKRPQTFHSFTIHFFWEDELAETGEKSSCFARATFLPEGGWQEVGRVPIDDYKNYSLVCTFLEE